MASPPQPDAVRFERLYREHYAAVARYVRRRATDGRGEDVLAETFTVAWRRLADVPSDPLPWLYGVARNLLADERRAARSRDEKVRRAAIAATGPAARDLADDLDARSSIRAALAGLPETDREALRLVAWEGLDHARAAQACGITRVAFSMRLSRARRRLAAALREHDVAVSPTSTPLRQESSR